MNGNLKKRRNKDRYALTAISATHALKANSRTITSSQSQKSTLHVFSATSFGVFEVSVGTVAVICNIQQNNT